MGSCLYRLNFPNGKSYIGITKNSAEHRFRKHISVSESKTERSFLVHRAIVKYGAENVRVETLVIGDWDYLAQLEVKAIEAFGTRLPNGYNIAAGGQGRVGVKASEETLVRMRAAQKGRTLSAESRAKISASKRGKKQSPEAIKRRSAALNGHTVSAETRAKLSATNMGHSVSIEQRAKLSAAGMGHRHTAETCAKMSASRMGRKMSPETYAKLQSPETIAKRVATRRANIVGAVPPTKGTP